MSREYEPSGLAFASWDWYPNEDRFIYHGEAHGTCLTPSSVTQWLCLVHQHDRAAAKLAWQQLCEGRNPIAIVFRVSSNPVSEQWVELRARSVSHQNGQVRSLHGVFINVTAREKASQKSDIHLAHLTSFASTAAHDLKEPLRTIASYGEILKASASERLTLKENEDLQEMLAATGRLKCLLNSILEYSGLGRQKPVKQEFYVRQAIDASLLNLASLIR
jgi:signal transduction histidine kinase